MTTGAAITRSDLKHVHAINDDLFAPGLLHCLPSEERLHCLVRDPVDNQLFQEGFFRPIVPSALVPARQRPQAVREVAEQPAATKLREPAPAYASPAVLMPAVSSATDLPLFAVRPTTPMGLFAATTLHAVMEPAGDFPRTSMILGGSAAVVLGIAITLFIVFWVCRNQTQTYSAECKMPPDSQTVVHHAGYAPIPTEPGATANGTVDTRVCVNGNGVSTARIANGMNGGARANGVHGFPVSNGLPNTTMKHVPNGNGVIAVGAPANPVSIMRVPEKKKDFKEWYV